MKKLFIFLVCAFCILNFIAAQNVGIGNPAPTEKLHVDNGSIKIGSLVWNAANPVHYLKFGDGNFITLSEEEADDKLTIRAKEILIRPSTTYNTVPLTIQGSSNFSHFYFGTNEDTYIRGGKSSSNLILGDGGGRTGINVYPQRAMLEQNGAIGTTAAIFGGDGAGISLQKNWPVIGFNHYFDGSTHRSIGQGYSGILGINQNNGNLYYGGWNFAAVPNASLAGYVSRFNVTKSGNVGIGTETPESDIHIVQSNSIYGGQINVADGITLDAFPAGGSSSIKWNMQVYQGQLGGPSETYSWFVFNRYISSSWPWGTVAAIRHDNGAYYSLSDINSKKDIEQLNKPNMLSLLLQLNPAQYRYKENNAESQKSFGFISQEVEKVFPDLVAEVNRNKLLNYSGFTPIIVASIQEQQQQIETLQKENADLKTRLERLEKIILNN